MSLLANAAVIILQKRGCSILLPKLDEALSVAPKFLHEILKGDPRIRVAMPRSRNLDQAKVVLK